MSIRRRRRRRRVTYRTAMKKATEIREWLKAPHWTWWVAKWTYVVSVCVVWALLRLLMPGMTFGRFIIAGLLSPPVAVATWYLLKFGEGLVRRIRQTTEAGIPLSAVRMVRDVVSERKKFVEAEDDWARFCRGQKIGWDGQSPKLHRMQQTATGDVRVSVNPGALGGDLEAITRLAANGVMAGIMHCQEVSVQPRSNGKAWLTFYKTPPLQRSFTVADLPPSGKGRISFGIEESGNVAAVNYGLSMLIAGVTSSGKSVLFWDMFADILRDGQPTEMYFVDPKRTEFSRFKKLVGQRVGNIKIMGYCTTAKDAAPMFDSFTEEVHLRQERIDEMGLTALTKPTEEVPTQILVIDEMLDVAAAFPKGSPIFVAISQGRSTLSSVIGLTQMAKIETIGSIRDLFPLRACLRTMTAENTKAVLGVSENEGAPCSRIPLNMPGVGYYVTAEGLLRKFRAANVTDKQRDELAAGRLPVGMPVNVEHTGPPCFVYIGEEKEKPGWCGYVGVAEGYPHQLPVRRRRAQHRLRDRRWCYEHDRVENWWNVHIKDTNLDVKPYPSRAAALIAEERFIKELKPVWNIKHNGNNPRSNEYLLRYGPDSPAALAKRAGWRRRTVDAVGEYRQWGREHRVARRAQLAAAHQERVARLREERERFVQTVTERAA